MENKKIHEPFKRACDLVGGQSKMASLLGVSDPTVHQWIHKKRPMPAERCPQIEKIVDGAVLCEELLPSVNWSYLRKSIVKDNEAA